MVDDIVSDIVQVRRFLGESWNSFTVNLVVLISYLIYQFLVLPPKGF